MIKTFFYPILIFTIERELRQIDCPITTEVQNGILTSVTGYIPEVDQRYMIVGHSDDIIFDGKQQQEYDYWSTYGYMDTCQSAIQRLFTWYETFNMEDDMFAWRHVKQDDKLFRQGDTRYYINFKNPNMPDYGGVDAGVSGSAEGYFEPVIGVNRFDLKVGNSITDDFERIFNLATAHNLPVNLLVISPDTYELTINESVESFSETVHFIHLPSGFEFSIDIQYTKAP